MMWGYSGFGGGGFGIGMVLFWGLIVAGIVVLVRGFGGGSGPADPGVRDRTPLEILRERYAKGEIDKGEFDQKRHDLGAG